MIPKRTLLLAVAVAAVGLFVLPSTMALFAGQHTFYDTDEIACEKCHVKEYGELTIGSAHQFMACADCHGSSDNSSWNLEGLTGFSNQTQHAAINPNCTDCHGDNGLAGNASEHNTFGNVSTELMQAQESHKPFYIAANTNATFPLHGANAVCVACHTHTRVGINWQRAASINFTAVHNGTGWDIEDFKSDGLNDTVVFNSSFGYSNDW